MAKVLFVGESWQVHVQETKGFDVFTYDYYETAVQYIQRALESGGCDFTHVPAHMVEFSFPNDPEALKAFLELGQEEQKSLIHQTKGVRTKAEMKALARTLHT